MDSWIDSISAFVEANQAWGPWIVAVLGAAETTAFLSILVPSTAIMFAVGMVAASNALGFTGLWIGASLGAMAGSFFSFWLGRRYGTAILRMKPLSEHPEWVEKGNAAFTRWGPVTIFGGHFVTVLRPVVFLMAGMSGVTLFRFAFWNVLGCMAWAFVVLKFGEVGGHAVGWLWSLVGGGGGEG
ncbi:DedA family protein [Pseudogemmobacter sonorensis]|uniref:DedA family protein n=1 Tax=Pseudogemmobacter sonorensis TaxID=2989681 RepID=UPI0036B78FCD